MSIDIMDTLCVYNIYGVSCKSSGSIEDLLTIREKCFISDDRVS